MRSKNTQSVLKKQQFTKFLSNHIAINLAMCNPDSPLKKSYDNTFHCNNVKTFDGDTLTASYCKNRWCSTCSRIKTAVLINNYLPYVSDFVTPYFVTLTLPTCSLADLPERIDYFQSTWRIMYNNAIHKNSFLSRSGIRFRGIKKFECTLRPGGLYHYHAHLIVDSLEAAQWLVAEWLKRNPLASPLSQDIRPADTRSLVEVCKYSTKMTVAFDDDSNFVRLDSLFQILHKKRMFSAFGLPKISVDDDDFDISGQSLDFSFIDGPSVFVYDKSFFDWVNVDTGELLIDEPLPDVIKNKILKR